MSTQTTTESENKALLRRWFEEVWNRGQQEAIDQLRTPDSTATGLAESHAQIQDADQFKTFVSNMRNALPDLHISIDGIIEEGNKVALRLSVEGTHCGRGFGVEPTGNTVQFGCMSIARVENGKIAEGWNIFDQLGLFTQLGVIPKNSGPDRFLASQD